MSMLIDAIRDGMAKTENPATHYLGELLTAWTIAHPGSDTTEVGDKTLDAAMDKMRDKASKEQKNGRAVFSDADGMRIALEYFGIKEDAPPAPKHDALDLDALLGM